MTQLDAMRVDQITLFYAAGSPYARICRMAAMERGIDHLLIEVETTLRDPKAVVLPFNPVGRVPALALPEGPVLTETSLILHRMDRIGSAPAMWPADDFGLAAFGRVLGLLDGIAVWNRELRRPVSERSPSVLALEQVRANRVADALESDILAGGYRAQVCGRVDASYLALASVLGYAQRRHTVWQWSEGRPALTAWFAKASERPAFMATMPPPSGI